MNNRSWSAFNELAVDAKAPAQLKALAQQQPQQALKQSARQFEALFINMMLQSMRKASFNSGLLQSHAKTLYTSMLDQQYSQTLANPGLGLAELLLGQLNRAQTPSSASNSTADAVTQLNLSQNSGAAVPGTGLRSFTTLDLDALFADAAPIEPAPVVASTTATVEAFQQRMAEHARHAEQQTGIPAHFILAQAAMESGWGQRQIRGADGQPSHNLFGIKAGSDWKGKVAEVVTTEYRDGLAQKTVARFRAYASEAEAFADYAHLLTHSPRYRGVLSKGQTAQGFAQGLQQAGYATDPQYAHKLLNVIQRVTAA